MFDEQFNELESEPRLYSEKAEERTSEDGLKDIYTVNILDQDNNQGAQLETNELQFDEHWGLYTTSTIYQEGDWLYWFLDDNNVDVYHVEKAE